MLQTGIEIWDGLPGSGKSYHGTKELARVVISERRPIFTNMPIRHRVFRRYVATKSGSPARARYVFNLTRDHFFRFCERNEVLAQLREDLKPEGCPDHEIERIFLEQQGPNVLRGPGANWIPAGACLLLDEFHRWCDQRNQKDESPSVLTYATMHRHHMHRVIICTQDKMQVSIPWRRNAVSYKHFTDKRKIPFLFGIKLPMLCFACEEFAAELLENRSSGREKPISTTVTIPRLDGLVVFRLYDSFTHMGGIGKLKRTLESVRVEVEGEDYVPVHDEISEDEAMKRLAKRVFVVGGVVTSLVCMAIGGVAFASSRSAPAPAPVASPSVESLHRHIERERASLPSVSAVTDGMVVVGGRMVSIGGTVDGWQLEDVNVRSGISVWQRDGVRESVGVGLRSSGRGRDGVGS